MDGRIALTPGTVLKLGTKTGYTEYTVARELARGGSCIVYDASYTDNLGNYKLVRIKECYPYALKMIRAENGTLRPSARDIDAFDAAKKRLITAYQKNHELFSLDGLTNAIANTFDIYEANGTVYIVSVYMNGRTFTEYPGDTLHDCISLLISAAKVLERIHNAGYLYLDLKPDNILTLKDSLDLVQLFDFDSMISIEELEKAIQSNDPRGLRTSYTRGYASLEQQTGKLRQMGKHSDIYSLGAVLFYALWHRTPSAFDCNPAAVYDYAKMTYAAKKYQGRVFPALTTFFRKTLASYHADRYQNADQAISQLQIILQLSDETKPWLLSSPISSPAFFVGREEELAALDQLLHMQGHHVFNLCGMGGIGKSTLTRAYIAEHRADYGAVLWLYANGNTAQMICDDNLVHVNTIQKMNDESPEDYLPRKLRALAEIASSQHVLVIVDNVCKEHLEDLWILQGVGWDILLISRPVLADGLFPVLRVEELLPEPLALLFQRYAHVKLTEEDEVKDFITIANTVYGHTLTMELLGRQIARSYLTLHEAARMVKEAGFQSLPGERIEYIHDQDTFLAPMHVILDRLVEIDQFSDAEKHLLKILSVFEQPGIKASLLRELTEFPNLETITRLEDCGWLKVADQRIVLHPMMQEYIGAWPWDDAARQALDEAMKRLHKKINPLEDQPDLDKQFPDDYGQLYELLSAAEQLLAFAKPVTPASQLLTFRLLMDAPTDADNIIVGKMLLLLENPAGLEPMCVLRLYETSAFMLGRLEYYDDAHAVLKEMKAYLIENPSHYYMSLYHRACAVILNNQYGRDKDGKCLKYENAAIKEARISKHPDAKKQLAAVLLNKMQTLLETESRMKFCGQMLEESARLLQPSPYSYEHYHFDCVAAMYFAKVGDEGTSLAYLQRATDHVDATKDSSLSMIDHMLDEAAVIYIELGRYQDAIKTVSQAIAMCDELEDIIRYREVRFDAYLFLGRIYAMNGEYIKAENAFAEAEKRVSDSPCEWKLPLCPERIMEMAKKERNT